MWRTRLFRSGEYFWNIWAILRAECVKDDPPGKPSQCVGQKHGVEVQACSHSLLNAYQCMIKWSFWDLSDSLRSLFQNNLSSPLSPCPCLFIHPCSYFRYVCLLLWLGDVSIWYLFIKMDCHNSLLRSYHLSPPQESYRLLEAADLIKFSAFWNLFFFFKLSNKAKSQKKNLKNQVLFSVHFWKHCIYVKYI